MWSYYLWSLLIRITTLHLLAERVNLEKSQRKSHNFSTAELLTLWLTYNEFSWISTEKGSSSHTLFTFKAINGKLSKYTPVVSHLYSVIPSANKGAKQQAKNVSSPKACCYYSLERKLSLKSTYMKHKITDGKKNGTLMGILINSITLSQ